METEIASQPGRPEDYERVCVCVVAERGAGMEGEGCQRPLPLGPEQGHRGHLSCP